MPTFRLMDDDGVPVPGAVLPELDRDTCVNMQETMIRVNEFDKVYNDAQRQGRISFYLTSRGEEAASVGSAAGVDSRDWLLPQYRELGAAFWHGFTFQDIANQLTANSKVARSPRALALTTYAPRLHMRSSLSSHTILRVHACA